MKLWHWLLIAGGLVALYWLWMRGHLANVVGDSTATSDTDATALGGGSLNGDTNDTHVATVANLDKNTGPIQVPVLRIGEIDMKKYALQEKLAALASGRPVFTNTRVNS